MSSSGVTTQAVLPVLERLFKTLSDNQSKMEKIGVKVGYEASKNPYFYQ